MKKRFFKSIGIVFSLCLMAYAGEPSSTGQDQNITVNQIGEWEVITTMRGNSCQDKKSVMHASIRPLGGDTHMMGSMTTKGTFFDFDDNGTCRLIPLSDVIPLNAPSIMTKAQFRTYEWNDFTNKDSIKRFDVTQYSPKSISIEIEYTDGSILTQTFNRL